MPAVRWWRVLVVCAASLGATLLAPSDGTLPPPMIGLVILAMGLGLNLRSAATARNGTGEADHGPPHSDEPVDRAAEIQALERAAEDDPGRRQEAVDTLCRILRDGGGSDRGAEAARVARQTLLSHLRPARSSRRGDPEFWSGMHLDLEGASLHGWDMSGCRVGRAAFRDARFDDRASFNGARFDDRAVFVGARFSEEADFQDAEFHGEATFQNAGFHGDATFEDADFTGWSWFSGARFHAGATFEYARFGRRTTFDRAHFGEVSFNRTRFSEKVTFRGARVGGAAFSRETVLRRARFGS
ncbi:hypothetical protein GCM10023224_09960 [Streptomonospora halophila]|uniref:Pentapeptide repeat-containing protein n=1 Tax=Streptomonospora halophila TaxID=427369 RepID=A0ABP9G7U2_9ACTN